MTRRALARFVSLAVFIVSVPVGAHAGYCDSNIVIFSEVAAFGQTVNSNAIKCIADNSDTIDMRIINPGSDAVFVRYIVDLGSGVPAIAGFLDGLGFEHVPISLKRTKFSLLPPGAPEPIDLGFTFQTEVLMIPGGPSATGCITATIYDPDDTEMIDPLDTVTFHTVDKTDIPTGCD